MQPLSFRERRRPPLALRDRLPDRGPSRSHDRKQGKQHSEEPDEPGLVPESDHEIVDVVLVALDTERSGHAGQIEPDADEGVFPDPRYCDSVCPDPLVD